MVFNGRRFGTLCLFHLQRQVDAKWRQLRRITQCKTLESPSFAGLPFTEKIKLVPVHATVAYKGRIRIARFRTPATLPLGKNPVIHCPLNKGREGPTAGLDVSYSYVCLLLP
jgi:hypothetical protein